MLDEQARSGDAEIVARLRAGDEAAFAMLIDQYHAPLLRLARSYVHDAALAAEVVQDTWIALLESLDRFEGRASLKTWLYRILMNVARARLRKESRTVPFSSFEGEDGEPSVEPGRFHARWLPGVGGHWSSAPAKWSDLPEEQALAGETRAAVAAAVAALPDNQRTVITLRDIEGFDAAEVCNLLGISDTNQRVLLHRARSRVRKALEAHMGASE
jgi:RNA polymerase sigma-70 factor (ECF subfamily)